MKPGSAGGFEEEISLMEMVKKLPGLTVKWAMIGVKEIE